MTKFNSEIKKKVNGKVIRNITHSEKALAKTVIEQCDFIKSLKIKKKTHCCLKK